MKSTYQESLSELTPAEYQEKSAVLAKEIIDTVLRPKEGQMRTVVVMGALMLLYRFHVQSLPSESMVAGAMELASLAGELLKESTTHQTAPAGASVH